MTSMIKKKGCVRRGGGILTLSRECGGEGVALCTGTQCLLVSCVFPSQEVLRSKIRNLPLRVGWGGVGGMLPFNRGPPVRFKWKTPAGIPSPQCRLPITSRCD